jgi:hypothetical protein
MPRIHVLGAPGSGTTTLAATLAAVTGWPHHDADAALWEATDPPFTRLRPVPARQALLRSWLEGSRHWILSGSALGWGEPFEPLVELVIYLHLDPATRMLRLRRREALRHGPRIAPGGDMRGRHLEFMDWAEAYDTARAEQRSAWLHSAWLADRSCPVLRLDSGAHAPETLARAALAHLGQCARTAN